MSSSTRDELTEILDPWYRDHTTPFDYDCLKRYIVQRVKVLPKILIDNYCVQIELEDDDNMEFFMQKAKEELRETPEVVAQGLKELRELVAGIKQKITFVFHRTNIRFARCHLETSRKRQLRLASIIRRNICKNRFLARYQQLDSRIPLALFDCPRSALLCALFSSRDRFLQ